MKKSIPLDVSSTLGKIATDKPLEITPYANATGVTTEKAPVLIAVRSVATVTAGEFAARMVKAGGQGTEAQARLALNAVAAVLGDLVEEYGAITVNTPFGTIQTFIAGTLENAQDTPDPETNRAFLGVVVPEAYRRQFAQMTAYVPAEACPVALKRVRDKATNAKGIRGTDPFYLEGRGMTIGGEGETLELLDAVTRDKVCDVSVDAESKSPVQFLCTLAPQTALEAGEYLVRLTTLAGGETTLWPIELKVTLLEAITPTGPTVDDIASEGHTGEIVSGMPFAAIGSGLDAFDAGAGDTVKVKWTQGGVEKEALISPADVAADRMSFEFPDALVGVPMDTELTFEITFGETDREKGTTLVEE